MMNRTPSVTDVTDAYWLEQRFSGRQRSRAVQVAAGAVLGGRVAVPIEASPGCFARKVSLCCAAVSDWTVGWSTVGSPSPQPSPQRRGRMVHRLSITPVQEFAQRPSAKRQSGACCSLSLRERVRVRGKYSVEHAKCGISRGLLSILFILFLTAVWLRADQVEMQNGDRYLGTVLSLDTNTLVLRSAVLGT